MFRSKFSCLPTVSPTERPWYGLAAGAFVILISLVLVVSLLPAGTWLQISPVYEIEKHLLADQSIHLGHLTTAVPLPYYTVLTRYLTGSFLFEQNTWLDTSYLAIIGVSLLVLLVLTTYLSTFWFWMSQGFYAAWLYAANVQQLRLFHRLDYLPYVGLLLPVVFTLWVLQRRTSFSWIKRIGLVAIVLILEVLCVAYASAEPGPQRIILHYAYFGPFMMTLLFAGLVGHEFVYLVFRLAGIGQYTRWHVILPCVVYFTHLAFIFISEAQPNLLHYKAWPGLGPFTWLLISSLVALWSIQRRSEESATMLAPAKQWLALVMLGLVALATILYSYCIGDDVSVRAYQHGVLMTHIGFGIGFLIYIFTNFKPFIWQGLPIWKVIYRESTMPYAIMRLAGVVIIAAAFFFSGRAIYNYAIGGMHTRLAMLGDEKLAKHHYREASTLAYGSHRPNYLLGNIWLASQDFYAAYTHYQAANQQTPTPHAYLGLGNAAHELQLKQEAYQAWQYGNQRLGQHKALWTNIGLYHYQQQTYDSAKYYFAHNPTNILATQALEDTPNPLPTTPTTLPALANYHALQLRHQYPVQEPLHATVPEDPVSNAYVYNYLLALLQSDPNQAYDYLVSAAAKAPTSALAAALRYLQAIAAFDNNQVSRALREIDELQVDHPDYRSQAAYLSALWALQYGDVPLFFDWITRAEGYPLADTLVQQVRTQKLFMDLDTWPKDTALLSLHWQWMLYEKQIDQLIPAPALAARVQAEIDFLQQDTLQLQHAHGSPPHKRFIHLLAQDTAQQRLTTLAQSNPFNEGIILQAVKYLNATQQEVIAYNLLIDMTDLRPYAPRLLKAYIKQAVLVGLEQYAQQGLEELQGLLAPGAYAAFVRDYDSLVAATTDAIDW